MWAQSGSNLAQGREEWKAPELSELYQAVTDTHIKQGWVTNVFCAARVLHVHTHTNAHTPPCMYLHLHTPKNSFYQHDGCMGREKCPVKLLYPEQCFCSTARSVHNYWNADVQTPLFPPLLYLTFDGDYYGELTWFGKETAAREQVGCLLNAYKSTAISLTALKVFLQSFLAILESWCLKSTFRSIIYADC